MSVGGQTGVMKGWRWSATSISHMTSQVTFIYITLFTIQIVSKQL